jgi:hypothetical protein
VRVLRTRVEATKVTALAFNECEKPDRLIPLADDERDLRFKLLDLFHRR